MIRIGADKIGPRGVALGVVSPLEGNENELREEIAAGGKLIDIELFELSSKRGNEDDWVELYEVDMVEVVEEVIGV